jgi:acetolactate synthase-1/2/3 large subunit
VKDILPGLIAGAERKDYTEWYAQIDTWRREHPLKFSENPDEIAPQRMIKKISEITKGNAIIATDVGQHQMWSAQYYQYNHPMSWITSGGLGTMGFGFPAAMGAAVARPDRDVWCITGDGGFQMTLIELATAVHYKIPVKIAIMNNGYLGMVRQWQELFYGGRYSHSHLEPSNPDFVKLAESFGAVGMRATTLDELDDVLEKANAITDGPVVMDICVSQFHNVYPMIPPGSAVHEMVDG